MAKGHIKQLPSGSFRVSAYAGIDPLTRRAIRFKSTAKTEQRARIELGRLLKDASEGRRPESGAAVATLMGRVRRGRGVGRVHPADQRRIHPPHHQARPGPMKVRKVRGPILDKLYAELKRCGDLTCTGKPFIEHRNVPVLTINPREPRRAW